MYLLSWPEASSMECRGPQRSWESIKVAKKRMQIQSHNLLSENLDNLLALNIIYIRSGIHLLKESNILERRQQIERFHKKKGGISRQKRMTDYWSAFDITICMIPWHSQVRNYSFQRFLQGKEWKWWIILQRQDISINVWKWETIPYFVKLSYNHGKRLG